MRIFKENTTRKIDALGRVSIPKSLRDRLSISPEDNVEFFMLEDDEGNQYVCFRNTAGMEYSEAAKTLQKLGLEVPDALAEKIGS